MAIIEKTGVLTYLDSDGNEVRLYPKSKNETADAVISVLSSDWALDETTGMYKQDFTVNGITSESVPVIGLVPTGIPTPDSEAEAYSHITDAVTGDNTLTLYADEALATAITIIVKGISATGGSTVADISNLTAKYNELNSNLTATDNTKFRFATDGEGNYGYLKADDSFIPFSSDRNWTLVLNVTVGSRCDRQDYPSQFSYAYSTYTITIKRVDGEITQSSSGTIASGEFRNWGVSLRSQCWINGISIVSFTYDD